MELVLILAAQATALWLVMGRGWRGGRATAERTEKRQLT
jgi:hypothetical protein